MNFMKYFSFEKEPNINIPENKKGDKGDKGNKGDIGNRGNEVRGEKGDRGTIGIKGTSITGNKGSNGIKGSKGLIGATGPSGRIGPTGYQGSAGTKGERGATGIKGTTGIIGEAGTSFKIFKQFQLISELDLPQDYPNNEGELVIVDENDGVYTYNGPNKGNTGYLNSFTYSGKLEDINIYKGTPGEKGDIGDQGNKGTKGIDGIKGPVGTIGPYGPGGTKGILGPTGQTGQNGDFGQKGDQGNDEPGDSGDPGENGGNGAKGEPGEKGAKGVEGIPGENGINGINGEKGNKGNTGQDLSIYETFSSLTELVDTPVQPNNVGEFALINTIDTTDPTNGNLYLNVGAGQGNVGGSVNQFTFVINLDSSADIKGDKGNKGSIGQTGNKGNTGVKGVVGATGPVGSIGDIGQKGISGSTGPNGVIGNKGSIGASGTNGLKGIIGASGIAFNIYETYSTYNELINAPLQPDNIGEYVLISTEIPNELNDGDLYLNVGANKGTIGTDNQFKYIINLEGTQGLKGSKGEKGDIGANGETGRKGENGVPGIIGLKGPIGVTGPSGIIGEKGSKGDKGENGAGFIIYETYGTLAELENAPLQPNNVGEFAAVITEIKGDPSNDNIYLNTGANKGTIGTQNQFQFITNIEGVAGLKGSQGATGVTGITGMVGAKGPNGLKGVIGATGPIGFKGIEGNIGIKGETGDVGASGIAFRIYKTFSSYANLVSAPLETEYVGEFVLVSTEPPGGLNDGNLYLNVGADKGSVGTQDQFKFIANIEGTQGIKGNQGATGIIGSTGSTGPIGIKGDKGITGVKGLNGPVGPLGLTGSTGIKGEIGQRFTIYDTFTSEVELINAPLQSNNVGEFALISTNPPGSAGDGNLYLNAGANQGNLGTDNQFQYISNLEGSAGIIGPIGAPGVNGSKGIQGATGATGIMGSIGASGVKGIKGSKGINGLDGAKGTSIKGQKGEPGAFGPQGVQGSVGNSDVGYWIEKGTSIYYNNGNVGVGNSGSTQNIFQVGSTSGYGGKTFMGTKLGIGEYDATITSQLYLNNSGETFLTLQSSNNGVNIYLSSENQTEESFFISQNGTGLQFGINSGYIYLEDSGNMQFGPFSATPPATKLDIGDGSIGLRDLYTTSNFNIFINNDSKLYISEVSNRVGIGISTPETLLDVNDKITSVNNTCRNVGYINNIGFEGLSGFQVNFRYRYNAVNIPHDGIYNFGDFGNILKSYQEYSNNGVQVIITAQLSNSNYGTSGNNVELEVNNVVPFGYPINYFSGIYKYFGSDINGEKIYELRIGSNTWNIYKNEYDAVYNICENNTNCNNSTRDGYVALPSLLNPLDNTNKNISVNTSSWPGVIENEVTGVLVIKTPEVQFANGTGAWLVKFNNNSAQSEIINLGKNIKDSTGVYDSLTLSNLTNSGFTIENNSPTDDVNVIVSLTFIS